MTNEAQFTIHFIVELLSVKKPLLVILGTTLTNKILSC